MKRVAMFTLVGILFLTSCTSTEMEAHEPWARSAAMGQNGAVYMILHNHATTADELVGVSSDVATAVEIHDNTLDANGTIEMNRRSSVPFAADEEVEFKPGGLHIMLSGLKRDLNSGDEITVSLHFKNREDIILIVLVMDVADVDRSGDDHTH